MENFELLMNFCVIFY